METVGNHRGPQEPGPVAVRSETETPVHRKRDTTRTEFRERHKEKIPVHSDLNPEWDLDPTRVEL